MPSVISFKSQGGWKAQCDSRCFAAIGPDCDCMCGGANHGKGYANAVQNTEKMKGDFMENAMNKLFIDHPMAREYEITFRINQQQKVKIDPTKV